MLIRKLSLVGALAFAAVSMVAVAPAALLASSTPIAHADAADWATKLWNTAKAGDEPGFRALLSTFPAEGATKPLADAVAKLREHYEQREKDRAERMDKARAEMVKHFEENKGVSSLSKALVSAMELSDIATDKPGVLRDEKVAALIAKADQAAHQAEAAGQWLAASELFVRLQLLLEDQPAGVKYKEDSERVAHRLAMLRMYTPKRLWEMQNQRRIEADGKPLPPYNPAADDYSKKLQGVDARMVVDALTRSAFDHVDMADWNRILRGALDGIRNLATTTDLRETFPGLADQAAAQQLLAAVAEEEEAVRKSPALTQADCDRILRKLIAVNAKTVQIPEAVLVHEFGNGGMDALDDFSAIIWPHEIARFNKMTQGSFVGVGVQIEFDETSNVRVVTPIEGTPAHKAGIRPDDFITKVNGTAVFGLSLDQVVDLITGPRGTNVTVTVERKDKPAEADSPKKEIEFTLKRDRIEVASVKGWRRSGEGENDWSWFVDPQEKIGYVRVLNFTETTSDELGKAVRSMQQEGVKGMVLDLRFNPGGLLDQAVEVSRMFVEKGVIVMTRNAAGRIEDPRRAQGDAALSHLPVVVLINRGSASASEIVSGALQHYGNRGDIPVVVMGQRSYGKGSVQQVMNLRGGRAMMKLTTSYYMLPDERIIHRKPGAQVWGVDPNLPVEMLPQQIADALTLRKNADVLLGVGNEASPDPDDLINKNLDLQVEAARLLLMAKVHSTAVDQASAEKPAR